MSDYELYHYGVKGMKWGVRRYQNADGSLTTAGKKKVSRQYKKLANQATKAYNKASTRMYVDAYNKAADKMNGGEIDKFNARQKKKYGDEYTKRDGYISDYNKMFEKELAKNMNKTLNDFYASNKSVKKAHELVDRYGMTDWDDLAKHNEAMIKEVREAVEKG